MDQVPIITQEIRLVDDAGNPRLLLSAKGDAPSIKLLQNDGRASLSMTTDVAGRPSVRLSNPEIRGPVAAIEIDDKGAHVRFDHPGGSSSYLFLSNAGLSGVVLVDTNGVRRLSATVGSDGIAQIERFDAAGQPMQH